MHPENKAKILIGFVVLLVACCPLVWWIRRSDSPTAETLLGDLTPPHTLASFWEEELRKGPRVTKVTDNVYVAIGYALGNSILVEGTNGLVIIDTTENFESARAIKKEFRRISQKPIRAIIYTHSHHDHILGSQAFAENETEKIDIWAHIQFMNELRHTFYVSKGATTRAARQFGLHLNNLIIGPRLRLQENMEGFLLPTHYVKEAFVDITVAGIRLTLVQLPGETNDHLAVWMPDKKILMPGDNIYKAFPNLYAIRGTVSRSVLQWAQSLRHLRDFNADILIPSHINPLYGKQEIYSILNTYGDAVQFVHDQTVRFINKGLHPDEIATVVQLPSSLAQHPYLQEFYGTVEWSVKGVYDFYLGWFNGRVDDLLPLTPKESARRWLHLVGGSRRALHAARDALEAGEVRWALELTAVVLDHEPGNTEAKEIKAKAIKSIASTWSTYNGRNYILTTVLEDFGLLKSAPERNISGILELLPVGTIFELMATRLKAEDVYDVESSAVFNFTDTNEVFTLTVRNCILDIRPYEMAGWLTKITTTTRTFKNLVSKKSSSLSAYMSGEIVIEGGIANTRRFLQYFD